MYNEFDPKHYKGKWPCTTKTLYNEKTLIGRLHQHFLSEITEKSLNVFIMHVPIQRLIIPDLWIPLSGLLWSWYRIHCRRSLYFCWNRFSVIVQWRSYPIRMSSFPNTVQKVYRSFVLIKSGHSQSDIFCHFREKYRNTYKIKCLKTADSSTSLSFIKL